MFDPLAKDPFEDRPCCPDCEDGYRYYVIDPRTDERIECSRADYNNTPSDYREYEICETCNGSFWL